MNNHGVFYDEQVAALALFVGDTALARKTIGESGKSRIANQIDADGKQKRELDRTHPLHYTLFNLDAFTMLAEMGRHVGVDLWHYTAPSGGSIEKALRFVAPYADSTVKFPTPDIAEQGQDEFVRPMRRAAAQLGDSAFARAIEHVPVAIRIKDREAVNFPLEPLAKRALDHAGEQLRRTATALDPAKGYPRSTGADGSLGQRSSNDEPGFISWPLTRAQPRSPGRVEPQSFDGLVRPEAQLAIEHAPLVGYGERSTMAVERSLIREQ